MATIINKINNADIYALSASRAVNAESAVTANSTTNAQTASLSLRISGSATVPNTTSIALYNNVANDNKIYYSTDTSNLYYADNTLAIKNILVSTASYISKLSVGTSGLPTIDESFVITGSGKLVGDLRITGSIFGTPRLASPGGGNSEGVLSLGRIISLTAPSNGNVTLQAGVSINLSSSRVDLGVTGNAINVNPGGYAYNTVLLTSQVPWLSGSSIFLDTSGSGGTNAVYFVTASAPPNRTPSYLSGQAPVQRAAVQFARSGSGDNYFMYVYIGGRWRSASLA